MPDTSLSTPPILHGCQHQRPHTDFGTYGGSDAASAFRAEVVHVPVEGEHPTSPPHHPDSSRHHSRRWGFGRGPQHRIYPMLVGLDKILFSGTLTYWRWPFDICFGTG